MQTPRFFQTQRRPDFPSFTHQFTTRGTNPNQPNCRKTSSTPNHANTLLRQTKPQRRIYTARTLTPQPHGQRYPVSLCLSQSLLASEVGANSQRFPSNLCPPRLHARITLPAGRIYAGARYRGHCAPRVESQLYSERFRYARPVIGGCCSFRVDETRCCCRRRCRRGAG